MNAYGGRAPIRGVLDPPQMQVDVSTQADLICYESEDERMGRRNGNKRGTPYSKIDIREQYCINSKEVQVLDQSGSSALFGCLSKHQDGSCRSRQSFLSVCVGRVPSDENLHDVKLQPLPRRPIDDLERAYLRRRPKSLCGGDAGRFGWIPENEEPSASSEHATAGQSDSKCTGMKRGHTISFSTEHLAPSCPAHHLPPPPPPPAGATCRTKRVSFARSHTLTSFDDAIVELRKMPQLYKSQERLILSTQPQKKSPRAFHDRKMVKRTPTKTQATQTGSHGREPPTYLSLSPRTIRRVKMVSQGAQTNGQSSAWNGRRLMKSYSEAGSRFEEGRLGERYREHEVLTRTQSEEPRSPYAKQTSLAWPLFDRVAPSSLDKFEDKKTVQPCKVYKEIFIDFEPVENEKESLADGEMASEPSLDADGNDRMVDRVDGVKVSVAEFGEGEIPIEDEMAHRSHPFPPSQDSVEEEFHENLVYGGIFSEFGSLERSLKEVRQNEKEISEKRSRASTPDGKEGTLMATLNVSRRTSPFASSDSLANDLKDHSDGIWNESQSTVLQADFENGDLGCRGSSKKHLLLLQHQQRSSVDTEVLESDAFHSQSPIRSPSNQDSVVPFVIVAAVHQNDSPQNTLKVPESVVQTDRKTGQRKPNGGPEIRRESAKPTDVSETSTTDDYATACDNSGTDTSSKRSMGRQMPESKPGSKEGSSFESASSHSFAKEDAKQVVPSSPPIIEEEKMEEREAREGGEGGEAVAENRRDEIECEEEEERGGGAEEKEVEVEVRGKEERERIPYEKEELSGDNAESSSSGSYSLDSGQRDPKAEWSDQERARVKKEFKLDLSDNSNDPEKRSDGKRETSPRSRQHTVKSPNSGRKVQQQASLKKWTAKGNGEIAPKMVRSPAMPEGFFTEEWAPLPKSSSLPVEEIHPPKTGAAVSSDDESSYEYKMAGLEESINSGHSPRRQRRRGGIRGRRNQNNAEHVSRRKCPGQTSPNGQRQLNPPAAKYGRSPSHSPRGSPRKATGKVPRGQERRRGNAECPEAGTRLKAASAESLRSVSPGSDSVFYNEGEASHVLCHQCGREFEGENVGETEGTAQDIVQPPAGFADSPETGKNKSHRLYRKQEKRFRSEERGGERRRHSRYRAECSRAKSEERGRERSSKSKMRPHARSTDASMERLRGADSSPNLSEPLETGDEPKIYAESFKNASWICITEGEGNAKWNRSIDGDDERSGEETFGDVGDSTASEKEFKRKYQAATHRMVHRKSSMEMYKRMQSKSFDRESRDSFEMCAIDRMGFCEIVGEGTLKERLENLIQTMLVVWSVQEKVLGVVREECDKKVVVKRKSGEFGFRIHGSRPVVVSAIEPETPAESSGLEVGDIVLSVNGISVLEASHSDVVKLAKTGSDKLELEIARTSTALAPTSTEEQIVLISGFLNKRGTNGKWHQRWFALKNDNCLYYFKSQEESQPIGALMLFNYEFQFTPDSGKSNSFLLRKDGAKSIELSADVKDVASRWKVHLEKAMEVDPNGEGRWFEKSCELLHKPASSVLRPDCFGHLTQLEDKWRRRYCVLKDAALLLYSDSGAPAALAVACLQGYRVQSSGVSGKRFSFEVVPPESKQKHFYFYTDTEMDKKRWIAAIEYSIDRWMRVG